MSIGQLIQGPCLYMVSSVYGGEVSLGSRHELLMPPDLPQPSNPYLIPISCFLSLLLPTLLELTFLKNPPAPGHLLSLSSWLECPFLGASHGHLIVQVSAEMCFPDHP